MNSSQRQNFIMEYLTQEKAVSVQDLSLQLSASAATIRRDLDALASSRKLFRTHGGAVLPTSSSRESLSIPFPVPQSIANLEFKKKIAQEAAKLVSENDTVFIGCGSTFYVLAHYLKNFSNLKVVTTNLNVAYVLASYAHSVYFIGGELIELNGIYYTGGPKIPGELMKIFVNKAFIGVSGIDINAGLTIYDLTQLNLYTAIHKIAHNVILVCDKTKFGCQSAHRLGPIKGYVNTVVTNRETDSQFIASMKDMGIQVLTA